MFARSASRSVVPISEQPALLVFAGDGRHQRLVDIFRNEVPQRRGIGHRIIEDAADETPLAEDIVGRDRRIDVAELLIIGRPEKCERGDQGAGADSRHDLKLGAIAGFGPPDQEAGPERAVVAAAGNGEKACGGELGIRRQSQHLPLALEGLLPFRDHPGAVHEGKEAGVGEAQRQGLGRVGGRHGRQPFGRGAAGDSKTKKATNQALARSVSRPRCNGVPPVVAPHPLRL